MYFILVTVILSSLLLHPGLGELPEECPVESSGDSELEGHGDGVTLQIISCTTSHIEVEYERVGEAEPDNTLSILYTCKHPNGTQMFESAQLLIESTNRQSGTGSSLDSYMRIELAHGIVCDIYTCYTLYEPPPYGPLTNLRTTPVTCTVVDFGICTDDCFARGANACQIDTSNSSPLGYDCVCTGGYIWNGTHCENVNQCNTTDPDHQHNCSEGYLCIDLEGSFLCVNCTDREEWNGTSCVPTEDDSPTTYDIEPGVTTTTNTPTAYSLVSDGVPTVSEEVPTVIGVVCFLVLLVGLLVGLFAAVIYLHSKRKSKKSVYYEMNNYYLGYPCYPGYVDKIDDNFKPIDNIHPVSVDHLSFTFQTSSIESRLNWLWEEPDTNTPTIATTTLQHHDIVSVSTSRPCHLHLLSERSSMADLSSNSHHHGQSNDSCIEQSTGEPAAEQSMDSADSSSSLAHEEIRDHPQITDHLDDLDDVPPTDLDNAVTPRPHRCSCVTMESAGSTRQTNNHHFRQSSVSTPESERLHFDLTGSGLTDTSGYITCISKHDHLEELEQIS